ncbi:hypothetical protein [Bernardetia sp.]|uniref:hypothetical protein n=1 Tax=Bernardetia sp. TaxID=1937974 RepID=UPI0025BFE05F|nr:hypothetical protein [Bernardetia sp.]
MRQLSFLLLVLFTFSLFLSSCKKEDELSNRDKLIGKWKYITITSTQYKNNNFVETQTVNFIEATREYKSNGIYDDFFPTSSLPDLAEDGTWKLTDNDTKLLIGTKGNPFVDTLYIKHLTDKEIRVLSINEYTEDGNKYRFEQELYLKK